MAGSIAILPDVVELGGAAHEAAVERVDAEARGDAGRERGDVERVLGGLRLLRGEDGEDQLAVALGDRRRAGALVGQAVLRDGERGGGVCSGVGKHRRAEGAAQLDAARAWVERPHRGSSGVPSTTSANASAPSANDSPSTPARRVATRSSSASPAS
jgi:hypothetical protein